MSTYTGKTVFLGIDVHKKSYSTTIIDGEVIQHKTFPASWENLVKYLHKTFPKTRIKSAYEAGFCGFGLHRFLVDHGIENIVVNPGSIEVEVCNYKKTDKRDSKKIAQQLAGNRLISVYIPSQEQENRRCICRLRELYVKQRVRSAVQLKSFLYINNLIGAEAKPKISKKYIGTLLSLKLDDNVKFYIESLSETWLYFSQKVKDVEKKLWVLTEDEEKLFQAYRKIRGFGERIARILLRELGDTSQFSNENKLFSFCGLTPREHSSGEHKRLGHITRQGRPVLRKLLIQAAWVATKGDAYFSEYYERLKFRSGSRKAIVAVARKLIGNARCAIRKQEHFLADIAD